MSGAGGFRRPLGGSTPERLWSTDKVPEREQFPLWREVVREAFVPVFVARRSHGAFPSRVRSRRIGAISVSDIHSQAQYVLRTEAEIASHAGEVFFLNLPLSVGSLAGQDGRRALLRAGDFALVDSTRPFELEFSRRFRQVSLTLPHEVLRPLLAAPQEATAVAVPGNRGVGAVAAAAIRALAQDGAQVSRHEAQALTEYVAGLVALAVGGVTKPPRSAGRQLLLAAALEQIRRHHDDPDLAPAVVAERIGVSTSYLHKLFADRGTTFGRRLSDHRLDAARRDLENPARAHWTISMIALHHGFHDPSYFGRAFKARFGITPRAHRSAYRPGR